MALIQYLTQIQIDFGAAALLPQECARVGITRPLVISDAGVRAAGVLARALAAWGPESGTRPPPVFDQTPSNPTEAAVRLAVAQFEAGRCDGLVAIGGGSSMDLAKGVAIAATHPGALKTYATIEGAIIIVDDGRKLGFHSWELMPKAAICDPELTLGLPALLTAATGMDAIAHCLETFMSAAINPPADGIALDGLARGWAHIERATRDGQDRQARWQMMSCSMQGAMAFQKGLGCVHSLSHSLGGADPRLHHGTLNAVFLPAVVRFNASAESMRAERRLERIAAAMGLAGCDAQGNEIAEAIKAMNERLGLPGGLAAMGVTPALFDKVIDGAMADHCHKTNPRLATRDDYLQMLNASL
jgi:alcohol dehydrogenase class IV